MGIQPAHPVRWIPRITVCWGLKKSTNVNHQRYPTIAHQPFDHLSPGRTKGGVGFFVIAGGSAHCEGEMHLFFWVSPVGHQSQGWTSSAHDVHQVGVLTASHARPLVLRTSASKAATKSRKISWPSTSCKWFYCRAMGIWQWKLILVWKKTAIQWDSAWWLECNASWVMHHLGHVEFQLFP